MDIVMFVQDGTQTHFAWLDYHFKTSWLGWYSLMEWSGRSPYLKPSHFISGWAKEKILKSCLTIADKLEEKIENFWQCSKSTFFNLFHFSHRGAWKISELMLKLDLLYSKCNGNEIAISNFHVSSSIVVISFCFKSYIKMKIGSYFSNLL
jgi:hypothetical protein